MLERYTFGRKVGTGMALFLSGAAMSGSPASASETPKTPVQPEPKAAKPFEKPATADEQPLYTKARHITTQLADRLLHLGDEATGVHRARNGKIGRRVDVKFNSGGSEISPFDGKYLFQVYAVPGEDGKIQGHEAFSVALWEGFGPWNRVPWPLSTIDIRAYTTDEGNMAWGVGGTSFSESIDYPGFSSDIKTAGDSFRERQEDLVKTGELMNAIIDDAVHHQPTTPIDPPYPLYGPPNN